MRRGGGDGRRWGKGRKVGGREPGGGGGNSGDLVRAEKGDAEDEASGGRSPRGIVNNLYSAHVASCASVRRLGRSLILSDCDACGVFL